MSKARSDLLWWGLLAAIPIAVNFGPMLAGQLLSDSLGYVYQAQIWQQQGFLSSLSGYLGEGFQDGLMAWRPLMLSLFSAEFAWFGANATAWRAIHLCLHLLNCVLIGALMQRLWGGDRLAALMATLLFASFAATVETVAWVADGGQVLAMALALGSALCLPSQSTSNRIWLSVLMAALAMSAKETGVLAVLLCALVALSQQPVSSVFSRVLATLRTISPHLAVLLLYLVLRWWLFDDPTLVFEHRPAEQFTLGQLPAKLDALWLAFGPASIDAPVIGTVVRWLTAITTVVAIAALLLANKHRLLAVATVACLLLLTAASLPLLQTGLPGQGGRHLYFWALLWSIVLAGSLVAVRATATETIKHGLLVCLVVTVLGQALLQHRMAAPWVRASHSMAELIDSIAIVASPSEPPLLIAPDRLGSVYFARNAQGAMTSQPLQSPDLSDSAYLTTPELVWPLLDYLALESTPAAYCWSVQTGHWQAVSLAALDKALTMPQLRSIYRRAACEDIAASVRRNSLQINRTP
ncbi:MAG: hypothetical protein DHS20C11_07430 [Lysobacteraceae bacterium]|nr:MAG: hypothetical protein DHS20C11_07430 [Xanthomonadaceae bacterium]